jgi:hypothetical protein
MSRQPTMRPKTTRNTIGAGLLLVASSFGAAGPMSAAHAFAQAAKETDSIRRVDLPVRLLHAGSTAADVERVLGQPSVTADLGEPGSGDAALLYAEEPVRTRVVLKAGRVAAIALDIVFIDPASLPSRARVIKATMVRDGVTGLLGTPSVDQRWTDTGRAIEQMTFIRPGEPEFSVFLADGLVVDVRLGRERPSGMASMSLPAAAAHASVTNQLAIGLTPVQAAPLLGPLETSIHFVLKGQPVEYATYRERDGRGLVTVTFMGGVSTAFTIWPPDEL